MATVTASPAKPAAPPKAAGGAAKTVFGMPAMRPPSPGGAPPVQPKAPAAAPATPQAAPAPAAPAKPATADDAFKATIMGIPALDVDPQRSTTPAPDAPDGAAAQGEPAKEPAAEAAPAPAADSGAAVTAPMESVSAETAEHEGGAEAQAPARKGGSKALMWILIGVGAFLTLVGIAIVIYFFWFAPAMQTFPITTQGLPQAVPQLTVPQALPQVPAVPVQVVPVPAAPVVPAVPAPAAPVPAVPQAVPAPAPQQ
jgi:DNA polymerase-3 subunit gamma/tau